MTVEAIGPFENWRVASSGYLVPHIQAKPTGDGQFLVCVDNRFVTHQPVSQAELDNWIPILAHAMAVAAGYSCHGENSTPVNPYKVGVSRIAPIPPLKVV